MPKISKLSIDDVSYDISNSYGAIVYTIGEVNTGNKWIDDKPIFINIIELSKPNTVTYIDNSPNVDSMIDMRGIIYEKSTSILPIPGYSDSSHYSLINTEPDGRIRIISNNWTAEKKIIVILEYTKK